MANNDYPPTGTDVTIKILDKPESIVHTPESKNDKHHHKAKWTIMIYMAVDDANGISESYNFLKELEEIKNIIPALDLNQAENRNLRIFLQVYTNWNNQSGQLPNFRSKRFELNKDFNLKEPLEVKFADDLSMGSETALSDFIEWCQETGEADHYLLFLWGHGTGSSMFSLEESYENFNKLYERDLTILDLGTNRMITKVEDLSPQNLFRGRNTVKLRFTLRGVTTFVMTVSKRDTDFFDKLRGVIDKPVTLINVLTDKNDIQSLSPEVDRLRKFLTTRSNLDALVEQEISRSLKEKKNKIDILLIMGCCMQMVEFGYELRNCRNDGKPFYYIASEELIYFDGYNYKDSFKALAEDPLMDPETFAKRLILDAPVKNNYTEYQRQALAISCVDLTKIDKLAGYLDSFATRILKLEEDDKYKVDVWDKIKKARKQCRHFGEDAYTYSFIDVTWFFTKFSELVEKDAKYPLDFRESITEIIDFLKEEYIVQPWIGHGRIPSRNYKRSYGAHGVAIYFPESKEAHINNLMTGLGTAFDKNPYKGNGSLGHERFPETNEFTKHNSWYEMIRKYRDDMHGEISNYPLTGSLAPVDQEKKKLLEDKDALIYCITGTLLEFDEVKTDVIPNILLKLYDAGTS